ncbi:hypothetical protein [Ponticaulis sp.]|uniref:hypothetical protein n=1 Tax=Ponticaulis sp. TaxID=2020902 RepID=UPI000B716820|nr:hypothetical protein [Ponticaulis sp.]MAI89254.1 hypothetical protein [Ponticaulis sp.]OUY01246.1 MAG: hypothetical protein CBB65_02060 [Hyphomonadaceae bacterium TMED5]|tara:strand:+ start:14113 stop:15711 length:1599 start_codon:yes stop_codon:yes gene_type:complete
MKKFLLSGAAALVLASCGNGGPTADPAEVEAALVQLSLRDSGSGRVEFEESSVDGDDAVFRNVMIRTSDFATTDDDADADTDLDIDVEVGTDSADMKIGEMRFGGLYVSEEGIANFSDMTLSMIEAVPTDPAESEDVTATLGEVSLVNPSPSLAAWLAGVFGQGEATDIPAPEDVQFDSFSLSNWLIEGADGEDMMRLSIDSIAAEDAGESNLGQFGLSGLDLSFADGDDAGTFTLGSIEITGANTEILEGLAKVEEDGPGEDLIGMMYGNPLDPGFDSFELEGLNLDFAGLSVNLPSLVYDVTRNSDDIPTRYDMPEFTLTVNADAEGGSVGAELASALLMLGFDELVLTGSGESSYDPETDIGTTESSRFALADAFVLNTTSEIGGLSRMAAAMEEMDSEAFANGEQDPQAMMMEIYSELDFYNFSLSLTDEGLVDKALGFFAVQQGTTPETLRTNILTMMGALPAMAQGFGVDPNIAADLSAALSGFISGDAGELTISFDPETPFTLTELMQDPTQLTKERLGFSATAE